MPGRPQRSGGARSGSGPIRRRFNLSIGAATMLRELTRSRLGKRDVTEAELTELLESLIVTAVDARLKELEPIDQ